jgi:dephospho-CoA kinase
MIIGFTGKRGCGKDTAAERLVQSHGFAMLDFTRDVLAPILEAEGKEVTRENLMDVAMDGRKRAHKGIWAEKLCEVIRKKSRKNFTISGVRFPEEVSVFRKEFEDFALVSIACRDRARYERSMRRGTKGERGMTFEEYMKVEEKPTEKAVLKTMELADYAIDNNGTIEDLFEEVDELVKLIKAGA